MEQHEGGENCGIPVVNDNDNIDATILMDMDPDLYENIGKFQEMMDVGILFCSTNGSLT